MAKDSGVEGVRASAILPPLVRGPRLAGQRRRVLADLRASRRQFVEALGALGGPPITVTNTADQEARPAAVFEFIPHNVPADELKAQDTTKVFFNRDYIAGCDCRESCGTSQGTTCSCIADRYWHFEDTKEPVFFAYDRDGLVHNHILEHTLPIYECTEKCGCGPDCANKRVLRGRRLRLDLFKTTKKGWGIRCPEDIPKGTFVSCYRGELLDPTGSEARGREYDLIGETYLFDLDEWQVDLEEQNIPMLTIDAYKKGDISRFFNHSCRPNLKSIPVSNGVPQEYEVAFFTTRAIKAREELCFDYDPVWLQKRNEAATNNQPFDPFGKCLCGEKSCRGWIFAR
ncbi:Histone-lysine N-methyltransferase [Taphrina deformans PYCC 5710]|uniref:Histone-lysine N-methyltransferase n=1 Tax=Taphrina deformans (strain PYCC 5710 / ATCC 11124 / CBS 356.35 / IMI 108563 / JCM 9778 / NBRC 8474) TaxID=1097556 RepID=R4X961_TAPDE|nr:Histone-lysine N-methyltransferase [Taphrina deformans PYCC 5710]|eukprot:CCG82246.1 Histone-lysine N-methyltransferase [Taphrina deformans PYCC 5710]